MLHGRWLINALRNRGKAMSVGDKLRMAASKKNQAPPIGLGQPSANVSLITCPK